VRRLSAIRVWRHHDVGGQSTRAFRVCEFARSLRRVTPDSIIVHDLRDFQEVEWQVQGSLAPSGTSRRQRWLARLIRFGRPGASERPARLVRVAALVIGLALLCTAAGLGYAVAYARPRSGEAVTVVVEQGATARRIGALLEKAGLAPDAFLFDLAARLSGKAGQLKAGEYRIVKGTGIMHIVGAMARGEVAQVRVTLAEGLTAAQMAQALERAGVTGADKFMEIVNAPPEWVHAEFSFVEPGASLEGYLFPDTYSFAKGIAASRVVRAMLGRFQQVVQSRLEGALQSGSSDALMRGLTPREALVLASIVEREAKVPEERPVIAGVFLRRLKIGMPLQSCATVQYVLPTPKEHLTVADTQIDSPYNTYIVSGLPPGPISNPGLSSVEAVLNPADGNELYFVAQPDGRHVFSSSYAEHLRAKALIEKQAGR
jgi:UPF0755 protein